MAIRKNLMVRAGADFSSLYKETKKSQKIMSDFQRNISNTMDKLKTALIAIGTGKLIKDSISSAMAVEASMQQLDRIMGENASAFKKWANSQAIAFNMSKAEAMKYGSVYGNLVSTFTKSTGETMKYTEELLKSSSIVASATGRSMEDVMERIRSGLLGNTEAIEDLGIHVNVAMIESTDAFRKFANGKSWQQLNFQTQQQIRLMAILEQSNKKYGDSVNKNTASAQQQFIAQLKNIQLSLGQAFLPIYNIVLPALTNLASKLANVMDIVAQFSQALFGKSQQQATKSADKQASVISSVGDAYDEAGKKAKGAITGFDEINSLADSSGGGSGTSGGAVDMANMMPTQETTAGMFSGVAEVSDKVQEMANKVKAAFADMSDFVAKHKDIIVSAITGIVTTFVAFEVISNWTDIVAGFTKAWEVLSVAMAGISWPVLAIATAIGIAVGSIVHMWKTNESFRKSVIEVWNQIKTVVTTIAKDTWEIAKKIWDKYGDALLKNLAGFMKSIQSIILSLWESFLKPVITNALEMLSWLWDKHLKGVIEQLGIFIAKLTTFALQIWNVFVAPLIKFIVELLSPVFVSLVSLITDVFGSALATIADVSKGILRALGGIIDFITGVFTGNWRKAWSGVKDIFKGIMESLYSVVKYPLNLIIDSINSVIKGLNSLNISVPSWVPLVGGKSWGVKIPTIPKLAKGGIVSGPTIAMLGEAGTEAIVPLENTSFVDKLASAVGTAVMGAMQMGASGGMSENKDIVVSIDGTQLARVIIPKIDSEVQRMGLRTILQP